MASSHKTFESDPTFELWAELIWVVGQWICEPRGLEEARSKGSRIEHTYPGDGACDSCYEEAHNLVYDGLRELAEVYGMALYTNGRDHVPMREAARRALETMVARAREL